MNTLQENYRVIALDLPGHGFSDKPDCPYTLEFLSDIVKSFILKKGLEKVYLAGHSLGGAVCLNLVIQASSLVERLVLVNSVFLKIPFMLRLGSFRFLQRIKMKLPFFIVKASSLRAFHNRKLAGAKWLEDSYRTVNTPGALRVMFSILHANITQSGLKKNIADTFLEGLKHLDIPVLILYGKADQILPRENSILLQRNIHSCECIGFEKCGHELQYECCTLFCEEVHRFFSNSHWAEMPSKSEDGSPS